jgi:RNA ligase
MSFFPELKHISQIYDAIGKDKEFVFSTQGNFIFSCYKITKETTFPNPLLYEKQEERIRALIRREIRGLVFDATTGLLLSRTLHKFFNIGEKPETALDKIEIENSTFWVLEKLDGSMVTPLIEDGIVRFRTKLAYNNSFTKPIDTFVYGTSDLNEFKKITNKTLEFCSDFCKTGLTPIFEFWSPESKIVLDYKEPFLTLIAIRNNLSGEYVSYPEQREIAKKYELKCVKAEKFIAKDVNELVSIIKQQKNIEGFVIRFEDGRMFKIKCNWYIDLHKCKSMVKFNSLNEGNVWELVIDGRIDDVLPTMNNDDERGKLQVFNDALLDAIEVKRTMISDRVDEARSKFKTKKEFVQSLDMKKENLLDTKLMFTAWDKGKDEIDEQLIGCLKILLSSKTKTEDARKFLGFKTEWTQIEKYV